MKNRKESIKYECDNFKIIIYNFEKIENSMNFSIKLYDKKNIFMLKKSQNFKRNITEAIKEFSIKIGNKIKNLPLNLLKENDKIMSKKIIAITMFSLLSFGMINPVFANDLKGLDTPLIEMLSNNTHTGFKTQLDSKNILLEIYDGETNEKKVKESRVDIKNFYNEVLLIKFNVITDIKKEVINILSKTSSKEEIEKINEKLNKYYKNIDVEITMDSDDSGMNNEILSNLKQKEKIEDGYKYEMFLSGYSLNDIKNDKNSKKILYNTMLHELSHTIKGALSEDKTLLYDENIAVLFQQKLGKKIEGDSIIINKLNNQINLMEMNEEFIMSIAELEKTEKYNKLLNQEEKEYLTYYIDKIKPEIGVVTYDNKEIYGKRTKFTRIDYLTMINIPKTLSEQNDYLNKTFTNTLNGQNLKDKNVEISKIENNSLRLRNLLKYVNESNHNDKINFSNKLLQLFDYDLKDGKELIKNILNSLKEENGIKTEYYRPEPN